MSTTTTPHPDVLLPAGAVDSSEWNDWEGLFRLVRGADRIVLDASGEKIAEVRTGGIQHPDGKREQT